MAKAIWDRQDQAGRADRLGSLPGIDIVDVKCHIQRAVWSPMIAVAAQQVIFISSGGFLHQTNGRKSFVDAACALVLHPGDEFRVAHPLGFGDRFTVLDFAVPFDIGVGSGGLPVADSLFLHHRRIVSMCRLGIDTFELADRISFLLSALTDSGLSRLHGSKRTNPITRPSHHCLADHAAEMLIEEGLDRRLDEVAALLNVSAAHLSRVFRAVRGMTLASYRNRLRVRAVMTDLQEGETNLRELAARHGFADQSHLIRVVQQQLGITPGRLRELLRLTP